MTQAQNNVIIRQQSAFIILPENRSELTAVGRSATFRTETWLTGGPPCSGYSSRDDDDDDDRRGMLHINSNSSS